MLRDATTVLLCSITLLITPLVMANGSVPLTEAAYIREALVKQGLAKGWDKDAELNKRVEEFRNEQLAHLALEKLSAEGMPDFTARAEELYQARLDKQYRLPLRLRVRILEMRIPEGKQADITDKLKSIRADVLAGKLDFKTAVLEYSQAPTVKLTEGDSQWLTREQVGDTFFSWAEKLSQAAPLSEVLVHEQTAYLLYFLDRQEPETLTFAAVKDEIIAELQEEYRKDQEKLLLDKLRAEFQQREAKK